MNSRALLRRWAHLFVLVILATLIGCGGSTSTPPIQDPPPPPPPPPPHPVNHVIFLAAENRSFDHYFGKLNDYRSAPPFNLPREVNGLPDDCSPTTGGSTPWTTSCSAMNLSPDSSGVPTTPVYAFHLIDGCIEGLSPDWIAAHWDFNVENPSSDTPGTLGTPTNAPDGFVVSAASAALANSENDVQGIRAMGYYTGTDLPYHNWLATEFATSDSWFNSAPMRTQPNRYYMMGATSGGYAYPSTPPEPPIQSKTIFDSLQAAGVSWKIYTQTPGRIHLSVRLRRIHEPIWKQWKHRRRSDVFAIYNRCPERQPAVGCFSSKNLMQMRSRMGSATTSRMA